MPDQSIDAITIDVVEDDPKKPSFSAGANSTPVDFVRFGLWDCAMRVLSSDHGSSGPAGPILFNDADERANFIGSDSRRFYIRVVDKSRTGEGLCTCEWVTLWADKSVQDANATPRGAGDPSIILVEEEPGVFVSNALMLACTDIDAGFVPGVVPSINLNNKSDLLTHVGVETTPVDPLRRRGQSHYRIRQGSMFGWMRVTYPPLPKNPLIVPIFRRNPEERRRVVLQIVVPLAPSGGKPVVADIAKATSSFWTGHFRKARAAFERVGLLLATGPITPTPAGVSVIKVSLPTGEEYVNIFNQPLPNDPFAGDFEVRNYLNWVEGQLFLPTRRPSDSIFYAFGDIDSKAGFNGKSFPTSHFGMIGMSTLTDPAEDYVLAHELGHVLMPGAPGDKKDPGSGGHWIAPELNVADPQSGVKLDLPNGKLRFFGPSNLLEYFIHGFIAPQVHNTVCEVGRIWEFPDKFGFRELAALKKQVDLVKEL